MSTICELCFPDMEYIGNLSSTLVIGNDPIFGYCLIEEPCHNGDILIEFEQPPTRDPVPDDEDEAEALFEADSTWWERLTVWIDTARAEMKIDTDLRHAWYLIEDLRKSGYDPEEDGDVELWMYDHIAQIIEAKP